MENSLVSIITPAFNCANSIEDSYKSILAQSYKNWEWIIVEDHSKDGSFEFISKIIKDDKRVHLYRTSKNSGAAIARNIGIDKARGKYIAFLDADDLWEKNKLTEQINFMKKNGYFFTFTDYYFLFKNGKITRHKNRKSIVSYKDLLKRNYIGCLTVIYDAEKLGKKYMPIDCVKREDHGAWLDITKTGINAFELKQYLSKYRVSGSGVSSNKFKMLKYQYLLYRKHEGFGVFKSLWYSSICCFNKIFIK